jgi:hypothetical protein
MVALFGLFFKPTILIIFCENLRRRGNALISLSRKVVFHLGNVVFRQVEIEIAQGLEQFWRTIRHLESIN